MYIIDGIAYAGDSTPAIRVVGIRPVAGHRLWLRFNNGEAKVLTLTRFWKLRLSNR